MGKYFVSTGSRRFNTKKHFNTLKAARKYYVARMSEGKFVTLYKNLGFKKKKRR